MSTRAIRAHFRGQFGPPENMYMMELQVDQNMKTFSLVEVLQALHESVVLSLKPLSAAALKGISSTIKESTRYLCHLLPTSCIAGHPEAEGMVSVKKGSSTFLPCHIFSLLKTKCKNAQRKACEL